jgi:hypothetical protein
LLAVHPEINYVGNKHNIGKMMEILGSLGKNQAEKHELPGQPYRHSNSLYIFMLILIIIS